MLGEYLGFADLSAVLQLPRFGVRVHQTADHPRVRTTRLGVSLEDPEQGFGRPSRASVSLLPILERALADTDHPRELRLGNVHGLPELADIDGIVREEAGGLCLPFSDSARFLDALAEIFE